MYFFLLLPFSCAFFKFVFLWSHSYPGCWYLQTRWIGLKTIAHWTKQCPKQERGEAHLPPMRLSFQAHYLFYLLKFLAPENTQTTPQTHAREIWIRKMGGRKEKRGWERETKQDPPHPCGLCPSKAAVAHQVCVQPAGPSGPDSRAGHSGFWAWLMLLLGM